MKFNRAMTIDEGEAIETIPKSFAHLQTSFQRRAEGENFQKKARMSETTEDFEQIGLSDAEESIEPPVVVEFSNALPAGPGSPADAFTADDLSNVSSLVPVNRMAGMEIREESKGSVATSRSLSSVHSAEDTFGTSVALSVWTCSDQHTTTSSHISGFSCLDLDGESKRSCRRCTFFNSTEALVCVQCDFALVQPNPDTDAQIALSLQKREEEEFLNFLRQEEHKRKRIVNEPVHDQCMALRKDIQDFLRNHDQLGLQQLDHVNFLLQASSFMKIARSGEMDMHVGYHFSSSKLLEQVKHRGFHYPLVVSSDSRAAKAHPGRCVIPTQGQPLRTIVEGEEEQSHERPAGDPSYTGWIIAYVGHQENTVQDLRRQVVRLEGEKEATVDVVSKKGHTMPVVAFDSNLQHSDELPLVMDGLRRVFFDFFCTDWDRVEQAYGPKKQKHVEGLDQVAATQPTSSATDGASSLAFPLSTLWTASNWEVNEEYH